MFSLESLYKSMVKQIEFIRISCITKGLSDDMTYYAWDSRGQETELPNKDLIGIIGWTYADNEGLPVAQFGVLTSLVLDINQFREVRILDEIRKTFVGLNGDYHTIPLLDPDTGTQYSSMQISDFEVMPAGRSETRSTRNIGIELIRTEGDGR